MNTAKTSADFLLIDDDHTFAEVLARSLEKRGFKTLTADTPAKVEELARIYTIGKIVLDMKLDQTSGLKLLLLLPSLFPGAETVILTGYSSISTAVEAIKLGAMNYICKPCNADDVLAAFEQNDGNPEIDLPDNPPSINRVLWEHLQKVLQENSGNISATARELGMHRRTLQRKLQKKPLSR